MDLLHNDREPTLTDVLLALKDNIFASLHSSEVCQVKQVNSDDTYICQRVGSSTLYTCYAIDGLTIAADDFVLVTFTDHSFVENLVRIKSGLEPIEELSTQVLHNTNNGIIVGLL